MGRPPPCTPSISVNLDTPSINMAVASSPEPADPELHKARIGSPGKNGHRDARLSVPFIPKYAAGFVR